MLILKLVAILLTVSAGLLQVGLDYLWHDKRTSMHKLVRRILVGLMIIGGVAALVMVVIGDRQMDKQSQTIEDLKKSADAAAANSTDRERIAQRDRDEVKKQLLDLQSAVKPVVTLATARYPQLESTTALARFAEDIQSLQEQSKVLEQRTIDLAQRDSYRPLTAEVRNNLTKALGELPLKFSGRLISITITADAGHAGRQHVASELRELLAQANITVDGPKVTMTMSKRILPPVAIAFNPEDSDIAQTIASILQPFLKVRFEGQKKIEVEKGRISLALHGEPVFSRDGSVTFP